MRPDLSGRDLMSESYVKALIRTLGSVRIWVTSPYVKGTCRLIVATYFCSAFRMNRCSSAQELGTQDQVPKHIG